MGSNIEERNKLVGFIRATEDFMFQNATGIELELIKELRAIDWSKGSISSVRVGVSDTLEMSTVLTPEATIKLDQKLSSMSLPSLTVMRGKQYRNILKTISKGKIRNKEEWYALQSFMSGIDDSILNEDELMSVNRIMQQYEIEH